jgi:hypothetical protein
MTAPDNNHHTKNMRIIVGCCSVAHCTPPPPGDIHHSARTPYLTVKGWCEAFPVHTPPCNNRRFPWVAAVTQGSTASAVGVSTGNVRSPTAAHRLASSHPELKNTVSPRAQSMVRTSIPWFAAGGARTCAQSAVGVLGTTYRAQRTALPVGSLAFLGSQLTFLSSELTFLN